MTKYTYDENIVSDLYKESRGFRPSQDWFAAWNSATKDQKQATWDDLLVDLDEAVEQEARDLVDAIDSHKKIVAKYIELGARDEETAIRWMVSAERFENSQDVEGFVWSTGTLFSDYGRDLVTKIKNIKGVKW